VHGDYGNAVGDAEGGRALNSVMMQSCSRGSKRSGCQQLQVERFEYRPYSSAGLAETVASESIGGVDIRRITLQGQSIQRSTRESNVESHVGKLGVLVGFRTLTGQRRMRAGRAPL
jgi:hypothetical protein